MSALVDEKTAAEVKVGDGRESAPAGASDSSPTVPEPWGTFIAPAASHQCVLEHIEPGARVRELGFVLRDDARRRFVGVHYSGSSVATAKTAERAVRKRVHELLIEMCTHGSVDSVEWEPIEVERHSTLGVVTDLGAMPGLWVDEIEPGEICRTPGCESLGEFEEYVDGHPVHFAGNGLIKYDDQPWLLSAGPDGVEIRTRGQLETYIDEVQSALRADWQRLAILNARIAAECECWGAPPAGTTCERCGTVGRGDAA